MEVLIHLCHPKPLLYSSGLQLLYTHAKPCSTLQLHITPLYSVRSLHESTSIPLALASSALHSHNPWFHTLKANQYPKRPDTESVSISCKAAHTEYAMPCYTMLSQSMPRQSTFHRYTDRQKAILGTSLDSPSSVLLIVVSFVLYIHHLFLRTFDQN